MLSWFDKGIDRISETFALVGFFGLLVLAVMTSLDVLLRWLFSYPLQGVNDVTAIVIAVVIAACLPANLARKQNITIEFVGTALGPRAKAALDAFGGLFTLLFVCLLAWRMAIYANEITASGETTWVLKVPVGPAWWIAVVFMTCAVPVQVLVIARDMRAAFGGKVAAIEHAEPML